MVYVYKKLAGGKAYYYLRASERRGKRVIAKDIAYLGSSPDDVKKALAGMTRYKDDIRRAYRNIRKFLESDHWVEKAKSLKLRSDPLLGDALIDVEACRLHFNEEFAKRGELTRKETFKNFIIEFAFNTTSIEGNTISLKDVRSLLEDGKTPKDKTLREIYDLQNTEKAFLQLLDNPGSLSHDLISGIHSVLMENIDRRTGYRTEDVRVIRSAFDATPAPYVKTDMDLLLKWHSENERKLHPFALAVIFHHKFEKIHPFMDGNGRAGRMLLNHLLMTGGCPPVIISKKSRSEYLDALGRADKSPPAASKEVDYSELVQFVAKELSNSYWNIFL